METEGWSVGSEHVGISELSESVASAVSNSQLDTGCLVQPVLGQVTAPRLAGLDYPLVQFLVLDKRKDERSPCRRRPGGLAVAQAQAHL